MLNNLSWQGTDSLVGYLCKIVNKETPSHYWYKVIIEDTKEEIKGSYGSDEQNAIDNYKINEQNAIDNYKIKGNNFVLNAIPKSSYDIIPIRKIF